MLEGLAATISLIRFPGLSGSEAEIEDMRAAKKKVDELYLERITQLPTKQLNEILMAHEREGGIRRAIRTIETILSELTRRTILDDTNESDLNDRNGDIDGPRKKSQNNSKKAVVKRRKTVKNR